MKSEMTKCSKCIYASWLGKEGQLNCLCDDGCEFKEKETRVFEIEFNGEKLLVRQFNYYNNLDGELVCLTIHRNEEVFKLSNEVLSAPHCRCFLNKTEVVGLLKATKSRVIK